MICLFTDFGAQDIYVGQVKMALQQLAPAVPVIDLLHAAPAFDVAAAAHLLAAFAPRLVTGSVTMAVIDPGVGGERRPVALDADGRWYVGPDNGLLSVVAARAQSCLVWEIAWRPVSLSATFHGRDLFVPVAAMLGRGDPCGGFLQPACRLQRELGAGDLPRIIYIDHYGNVISGLRAAGIGSGACLEVAGRTVAHAPYFSAVAAGQPFWYENSLGLVEVALNCGSAAATLGLAVGDEIRVLPG